MRIVVADDHALFRDILNEYIQRADQNAVVYGAGTLNEAINIIEKQRDWRSIRYSGSNCKTSRS